MTILQKSQKNPLFKSSLIMMVSFFIYLITFYLIKPSFVVTYDDKGIQTIKKDKVTLYSALFSIITSIIFLVIDGEEEPLPKMNMKSYKCGCGIF